MLEQLTSSELRGVALRWRIHKKLKKLENTLSKIQAVLIDAENKQMKDIKVEKWLDDLKHVAYDVEDILDKVSTEALRQKLEAEAKIKQVRKKLIPYNLRPRVVSFKFGIVSKISTINKELEEIALERDRLGLQEGVGAESVRVEQRRPTSSLLNESLVYGREEDKAKIIKLLLSDEHNHNGALVIPIVGMPGVGKTTLAQLVYNGDSVKQYFDLKAWVYVSEGYNMLTLTKAILESATGQSCNLNELDSLQANLKKELKDKKFLLVLDEVWNENYNDWCALLSPFRGGIQESKIIVTTRSETVSSVVGNVHAYKLNVLSEKDCFLLFKQHAFVDGISETNPNLEELGRGIVGKCNGLPLAAKTLGGLLHSKVDVNEWRNILESELWELPEDRSEILPALRLSYHHLPAHLKRCFAYCSIFPKGYEFEETLVFLWMAEGFVQPNERKHMEDIAGGTCFRLEDGNKSNNRANKIPEKARHSSFLRGQYDRITKFQAFHELKLLRTFLPLTRREDKISNKRVRQNFTPPREHSHFKVRECRCIQLTDASRANLKDKLHIQGLKLEWSGASSFHEDVLRVLQPHMNLKELFISSYLGEFFPSWIGDQSLSNLVILKLFKCSKCKSLPPLGQLPMLKDLYIEGMHRINCVGREFYGDCLDKTFPSLEILSFREMLGLVEWFGLGEEKELKGIEEFPNLTKLTMQNCPKLQKLSPCFPALVSLEVKDCKALIALPKLLPSSVSTDQPSKRFKKGQRSSSERGDELTPHLCELVIGDCLKLREAPFPLPFMTKLEIRGCSVHHFYGQEESNKLLLEGFAEITSLNSFHISEFVNTFPTGISSSHDCTRRLRNL
ncbi:PREDICTED: putative disease resistance RPP13-like protein 1 [Nelumbo nucifera]|uniref:Disease resistance RPP13-like protein 1 n=1 Tax=Nelumbo nucifera TaxID=4432 RepID=A0A1U8QB86_NELNU|nr:PREDICTED: putative disease resistance RPP13-like protein 1 [Nelumbo nucifera]